MAWGDWFGWVGPWVLGGGDQGGVDVMGHLVLVGRSSVGGGSGGSSW